jgi:two-component system chemotaxis sensor kinase CheA
MALDPYRYFRVEARELLDQCAQSVLELEKGGSSTAQIQRLLRLAHTLKGASHVVKQAVIADRAHGIEDALAPFREVEAEIPREGISKIREHLDEIGRQLVALRPAGPVATTATSTPAMSLTEESSRTIRADILEMDAVLDGVAETHALLTGLRKAASRLEQAQGLANVLLAQLAAGRRHGGTAERMFAIADELHRKVRAVGRAFGSTADQLERELHQLRDAAERLRLVSVGSVFTMLERTALDTARAVGKQVTFDARGGEMRLDSHVLETLQGALIQMIRNAAAHGIELPDERKRAGKPEIGRIGISVSRRGRQIVFECRDDGGGLDLEAVRRVALQRGALGSEAQHADADALIRLLLRGGITTATNVTEMSGRGIGLDIVREATERLGGSIVVQTERGLGTTFELTVPPSLAALEALIVEAGNDGAVAIPLDAIRGIARITPQEILPAAPGVAVLHEQQAISFIPLSAVLDGTRQPIHRRWNVVILAGADGLAAIGVDRLLGTANLVIRPLPDHLPVSPAIAGVALDAEGNPRFVLDPNGIVTAARRGAIADVAPKLARTPILVIDDSLTTRMLEQTILESAGYEVDVALSAEEALETAHRKRYALFLVDVEMPGMDGFAFVEQIRSDPTLCEIPAILVTSRAAPDDLERGRAAGAQGYIVKSEFDQAKMLALIKRLMA